jgi:hypothetical protein
MKNVTPLAPPVGTFLKHPELDALPALVARQRKLAKRLAPLKDVEAADKALRAEIDGLLMAAGLGKGDAVTCNGFTVKHNERIGQERINGAELLAAGVAVETVTACTHRDETARFATVDPMKGIDVVAPKARRRPTKALAAVA